MKYELLAEWPEVLATGDTLEEVTQAFEKILESGRLFEGIDITVQHGGARLVETGKSVYFGVGHIEFVELSDPRSHWNDQTDYSQEVV